MVASLLASANILHFYQKNLNKTTQKKIRGKKKEAWPVSMFPETKKETRGSPALFVSGNFQGNQRVFVSAPSLVLHSGNSLFSLSLRARLGQNLRRNRPGKYPGFSRYTRKIPGYFADLADFGPKSADFHGVSPRETREETRGCCRETRKGNETGCARKHGYSLKGGESVASSTYNQRSLMTSSPTECVGLV